MKNDKWTCRIKTLTIIKDNIVSEFEKELREHPPVTEKQIRAMYMSMGRKPSEAQIRQTMKAFKQNG